MKITDISILCKWEKLAFYQILICPPVYVCVCKPVQELQEMSDLCNCKQRFLYQILSYIFLFYQILNYLKIIQCDFLDFFFRFCLSQLRCAYDENNRSLHSL